MRGFKDKSSAPLCCRGWQPSKEAKIELKICKILLCSQKKRVILAKAASMHTQLKAGGRRICFEARARCANPGSGHILSPLRDGV